MGRVWRKVEQTAHGPYLSKWAGCEGRWNRQHMVFISVNGEGVKEGGTDSTWSLSQWMGRVWRKVEQTAHGPYLNVSVGSSHFPGQQQGWCGSSSCVGKGIEDSFGCVLVVWISPSIMSCSLLPVKMLYKGHDVEDVNWKKKKKLLDAVMCRCAGALLLNCISPNMPQVTTLCQRCSICAIQLSLWLLFTLEKVILCWSVPSLWSNIFSWLVILK